MQKKSIILLVVVILLIGILFFIGYSLFKYFNSSGHRVGIDGEIDDILISEDGKIAYLKLRAKTDQEIVGITFNFRSDQGEYPYESDEVIYDMEVPCRKTFWQWLFGEECLNEQYNFVVNVNETGLENFHDAEGVSVSFQYKTDAGGIVDTGVIDTVDPSDSGDGNGDWGSFSSPSSSSSSTGGGLGCSPSCFGKECGSDGCGSTCGTCDVDYYCNATKQCVETPLSCTHDEGCLSVGVFCSGNIPYTCSVGEDGCLNRTNHAACSAGEICSLGSCVEVSTSENKTSKIDSGFGITWTFDKEYRFGRFANGDYWVLGPVNIIDIDPGWDGEKHGSMVNPDPGYKNPAYPSNGLSVFHAWDTRRGYFNEDLLIEAPVTLNAGDSLVSVIGWTPGDLDYPNEVNGIPRPTLKDAAILTILGEVPENNGATVFRPPYAGTDKPLYSTSDLKKNTLPNLDFVASVEDINEISNNFERPWIDLGYLGDTEQYLCPQNNMPTYGSGISNLVGKATLLLMLDETELINRFGSNKDELLVRFVQTGIDYYHVVDNGGFYRANGGLDTGRKWPILFAGLLLDNGEMKNIGFKETDLPFEIFTEDCMTFYVDHIYNDYLEEHIGLPERGGEHCYNVGSDKRDWYADPYRRCCTTKSWSSFVLAAHIMGAKKLWNHPALFDYTDRYVEIMNGDSSQFASSFTKNMWSTYRNKYGCVWIRDNPTDLYSLGHYDCSECLYNCEARKCDSIADCPDLECNTKSCDDRSCVYTPRTGSCDDGLFCTGIETCQEGRCESSGNPCTNKQLCFEEDICLDIDYSADYTSHFMFENNIEDYKNNNHGFWFGSDEVYVQRQTNNYALNFDGIENHIDLEESNSLNLLDNFSISLWFKDNEPSRIGTLITRGDFFTNAKYVQYYIVSGSDQKIEFGISNGTNVLKTVSNVISSDTWYYLVGVWDDSKVSLYIDGVLDSENIASSSFVMRESVKSYSRLIGSGGGRRFFKGSIDEIMIYPRALSESEIQEIYNSQSDGLSSLSPFSKFWNFVKSLFTQKTGNAITGNFIVNKTRK